MSSALLFALRADSRGGAACLQEIDGIPIVARLARQLRGLGVRQVTVVSDPTWADAVAEAAPASDHVVADDLVAALRATVDAPGTGPLVVSNADIVTHDEALAGLLMDPRVTTGVLADSASGSRGRRQVHLRISRGRVVAAESAFHSITRGESRSLGVVKIAPADRGALADAAAELADLLADGPRDDWARTHRDKVARWSEDVLDRRRDDATLVRLLDGREDVWGEAGEELRSDVRADLERNAIRPLEDLARDPVPLLLVGLVRRNVTVGASWIRELYWGRPTTEDEVARAGRSLAAIDQDRVLLDSAVKSSDGFFTTFFVSPYSKYIARWTAHRGMTPNQVTTFSMLLGILAAVAFATGQQPWMIVGAVLLQLAFTFDCVDGQLARYTRQFSKLGAWLDSVFDRGKEYVAYVGLALGATATGDDGTIWVWAGAALAVQAVRHFVDFSYAAQQHQAFDDAVAAPLHRPSEAGATHWEQLDQDGPRSFLQRIGAGAIRASQAAESRAWQKWAKRAFVLPIGERFALISITAAIWGAGVTFAALVVWGAIAATYTVSGRIARSLV